MTLKSKSENLERRLKGSMTEVHRLRSNLNNAKVEHKEVVCDHWEQPTHLFVMKLMPVDTNEILCHGINHKSSPYQVTPSIYCRDVTYFSGKNFKSSISESSEACLQSTRRYHHTMILHLVNN